LIEISQEYAYLRTYRIDIVLEGDYLVRNLFEEIAKRSGLSYEDIIYLTVPEIIKLLKKEKLLLEKIEERKKTFVVFLIKEQIFVLEGDEAQKFIEKEEEKEEIEKEIKGTIAQRGKAIGKVVKVFSKKDIYKVNEGNIIVSPMTTPDMVIGLVRAGAIVTDEGGIVCHAAIISREFGIPCIIGTQIATKVLKDGDVVEIDAMGKEGVLKIKKEIDHEYKIDSR
jgi:phosphoenolpyruvate synthase/pyruvate phosphate dikinase